MDLTSGESSVVNWKARSPINIDLIKNAAEVCRLGGLLKVNPSVVLLDICNEFVAVIKLVIEDDIKVVIRGTELLISEATYSDALGLPMDGTIPSLSREDLDETTLLKGNFF